MFKASFTIKSLYPAQLSDFEVVFSGKGSDIHTMNCVVIDISPSMNALFTHVSYIQTFLHEITFFGDVGVQWVNFFPSFWY